MLIVLSPLFVQLMHTNYYKIVHHQHHHHHHVVECTDDDVASSVHYTTSCKHSLVLLRMGEISARNMLS